MSQASLLHNVDFLQAILLKAFTVGIVGIYGGQRIVPHCPVFHCKHSNHGFAVLDEHRVMPDT